MNPNPVAPSDSGAFSIKSFWLLCVICLSFFAGNLRADGDLSPADAVQAERLQKQIDAENKAAHDKAEKEWQKAHSSGGNATGLIVPAIMVCIVVGFAIYAKNKTAGKAFGVVSLIFIGGMVIVSLIDSYEWTHPDNTSAAYVNAVAPPSNMETPKIQQVEAVNKHQDEISGLKKELTQKYKEAQDARSEIEYVKPNVTFYWKKYQADPNDSLAKFNYDDSLSKYNVSSQILALLQADIKEIEGKLQELQTK